MDFVIEKDFQVIPIEVKSGKDYQVHSALNNIMSNSEYGIKKAYVLCNDNIKTNGPVCYLPIYMTMFIRNNGMDLPKPVETSLRDI